MNEEMEAEMTKIDLTPNHLEDSGDEGFDEAIPINIIKEGTKKSYKVTMSQDIETIDSYDNRTKVNIKNVDQYLRLYMKPISKSLIFSLVILSKNIK